MSQLIEQAKQFRQAMQTMCAFAPNEAAIQNLNMFDEWQFNMKYHKGDKCRCDGKLYVSKTEHNKCAPAANPAEWEEVV